MKSLLSLYLKHMDESLTDVMNKLHVNEDRLNELITIWIDQGHISPDNEHLKTIKAQKSRRREQEILENRRAKLLRYQSFRDSGFSIIKTAELMHLTPERLETFFSHEISRLTDEGVPETEAAEILRISFKYYKALRHRQEKKKAQQKAAAEQRLLDNQKYAEFHLTGIDRDLKNDTQKYLIFDIEAAQNPDEPIEISIIDIHGNIVMNQLIAPSGYISRHISKLTGITNAMVQGKPTIHDVMPKLKVLTKGKTMLSWGTDYDSILIKNASKTTGIRLECCFGCAQRIHMGITQAPRQIALGTAAGIAHQNHRALDDCMLVRKILLEDLKSADND